MGMTSGRRDIFDTPQSMTGEGWRSNDYYRQKGYVALPSALATAEGRHQQHLLTTGWR